MSLCLGIQICSEKTPDGGTVSDDHSQGGATNNLSPPAFPIPGGHPGVHGQPQAGVHNILHQPGHSLGIK